MLASELIYREVKAAKAIGKPVVVSMSDNGGERKLLHLSPADEIWAHPATITGSIGIFATIPTFTGSLDKVGVAVDGVGTTPCQGSSGSTGRWDPMQRNSSRRSNTATGFLARVSDGRRSRATPSMRSPRGACGQGPMPNGSASWIS
ncbi:MAG: S49 family peptidase [Steroidobacteraceae bacterium]